MNTHEFDGSRGGPYCYRCGLPRGNARHRIPTPERNNMVTLSDLLSYITLEASEVELDRLFDASKSRRRTLRDARAAQIVTGDKVRLVNISPAYLKGLTGTVGAISGVRGALKLDAVSTASLRYAGKRFYIPAGVTEYVLTGVPLSSCEPVTS